jgi:uncharacterized protein (DUF1684 family)
MRFLLCCLLLANMSYNLYGQSYGDDIIEYRKHYIEELLAEPRKPVQPSQIKNITFFRPDKKYCVLAQFTETPGSVPFKVPTHSGKQKPFREYGTLSFTINDTAVVLHAYQLLDLVNNESHKDDLFVPFKDITNYESTYGGGRYIDLSIKDIKDGSILLDFNKCYNPYCAYTDGFSCPIPPKENYIPVAIFAGEKDFQH